MKPLILILFVAASAQAQNVADAARQERARQAQYKSTRTFSDANTHVVRPMTPADVPASPATGARTPSITARNPVAPGTGAAALKAAETATAAPAPVDPAAEEMLKLRIRIRALEDQETSLKLQISDFTNQVYAPQSDAASHNEALTKLGETQAKLADVQKELAQARSNLQQSEIKAAAKK